MFVPVVDKNQKPLMPTTPARVRRWVQSGKATPFWKQGVFCVRLNVDSSAREVQPIAVGIDPGSQKEGYCVVSAAHTYLNIQADAVTWIKEAVKQRRQMRRTRPHSYDTLSSAARQSLAQHQEAAAIHLSEMAVETAALPLARVPVSDRWLCSRRHQGPDDRKAAVGPEFFAPGSGQTVVLCRVGDACRCADETGMGNQAAARPAWPQENGQENGRGVECTLCRCLVPGLLVGRRTYSSGRDAPAVRDAVAVAPPPITPTRSSQRRETHALRRDALPGTQAGHAGQACQIRADLRRGHHGWETQSACLPQRQATHPRGETGGLSSHQTPTMEGAAPPSPLERDGSPPPSF